MLSLFITEEQREEPSISSCVFLHNVFLLTMILDNLWMDKLLKSTTVS